MGLRSEGCHWVVVANLCMLPARALQLCKAPQATAASALCTTLQVLVQRHCKGFLLVTMEALHWLQPRRHCRGGKSVAAAAIHKLQTRALARQQWAGCDLVLRLLAWDLAMMVQVTAERSPYPWLSRKPRCSACKLMTSQRWYQDAPS